MNLPDPFDPGPGEPDSADDLATASGGPVGGPESRPADTPQTRSSAFRLAYLDPDFMLRKDLRPVRFQLELLKPDLILEEHGIDSTVVVFGSARVPNDGEAEAALAAAEKAHAGNPDDPRLKRALAIAKRLATHVRGYAAARRFGQLIAEFSKAHPGRELTIITGGGPGIMEAANRGASEAGVKTAGLNIVLPHEQAPNPYLTPELSFQFYYFALRKMHFLMRARALVAFPGGFGTLDELFETLCLIQTGKSRRMPVLLYDSSFWTRLINFEMLVEEGMISPDDLDLFQFVDDADEAFRIVTDYHLNNPPKRVGRGRV
ncbi:LOG family protein [Geminicoccus harenae]|uniref:LOG family protein n=1 Tax=Geminicoccus harenae TaxID=2498453 RepID=UPI00168B5F82|nr:TIGR00730 family Rossman fold protein [Geminicoccus harenae]